MRKLEEKNLILGKIIDNPQVTGDIMIAQVSSKYGEGNFISYRIMEGIEITYNNLRTYQPFKREMKVDYKKNILIINYCVEGRFKYEFADNRTGYVCDGELSFWGCENTVKSADFSLKRYKGITIILSVNELETSLAHVLDNHQININTLAGIIFDKNTCLVTKPNNEILKVLCQFYSLPKEYTKEYLKVKVLELLILLCMNNFKLLFVEKEYLPQKLIANIQKIKSIIEEHYNDNTTIEEFASIVNVNTTYLKKGFKYLYGDTINSYRKRYRMSIAEELLKNTDYKIIDIATEIGYANPGKFTDAFKNSFNMTPTLYRKIHGKFSE